MRTLRISPRKRVAAPAGSGLVPRSLWNSFLENTFQPFPWPVPWLNSSFPGTTSVPFKAPAVDISEDDKEISVKAEIPGLSEKDLEVSYADGVLYLKGEKKEEMEEKKKNTWHRESWQGVFTRALPIGAEVDWKKANATHKEGVLTVTIPKVPGRENRAKINVR